MKKNSCSCKDNQKYNDICLNNVSELWRWNDNQSEQGDILNAGSLSQSSWRQLIWRKKKRKEKSTCLQTPSITATPDYLSQVACHFDVVPGVVIEFSIDWLDDGFEGPGTQIDDEGDGPIF